MSRTPLGIVLAALPAVLLAGIAGPVAAQPRDDRVGDWKIGGLAYSQGEAPPDRVSDLLHDKVRIGSSLVPQLAPFAEVRPWLAPGPAPAVGSSTSGFTGVRGGILIDVPLGSFVFTPSFGAASLPRTARDPGGVTEFRSQLELGYEFENKSRFSLGYSRIATDGNPADGNATPNNVFGLYYRLPFGGQ